MIQYVANYLENIHERKVFPNIRPGYLAKLLPNEAPNEPESWEDIMNDVESMIMPGVTHWQHPHFHAYFPCGCSYTSICADILADGISSIGFTWCCATLGTTATCGFDKLKDIGPICDKYNIWLHVDAAYAGSSFICPEYRYLMDGIEFAMSFVFNPHKWLLINFDCSIIWYREVNWVKNSFHVDPPYLKHKHQKTSIDFRHMQIPLGRKFRSLKIWFTLRRYGVKNLQTYIQNHIQLAHYFEKLILADDRFEIIAEVLMGLVCFRIKNNNELTKQLFYDIETDGRIHLVSSELQSPKPLYFIRFAVCYHSPNRQHIDYAYNVISELCEKLLIQTNDSTINNQWNHSNINPMLLDQDQVNIDQ
ncbi:unnamed protein product [Schistosoma turkestanicum]|nr:unnamed protein product [Schistosoma turkestanicum]